MPYVPLQPRSLSGAEILAHVCAADSCTEEEAASNVTLAIRHRALAITFGGKGIPLLNEGHPLGCYLPTGPGSGPMVTIDWNGLLLPLAEVCTTDGKISFGDKTPWQHFEARRKDVLEIWPERAEKLTSVAEKRCEKWLRELAEQEPKAAAITQHGGKEYWQPLARGKFKGLSERAFERAWATVARDHEEMSKSGPKTRN